MKNQRPEDCCRTEIIELHDFFAAWFNGEVENTEKVFSRFSSVLFSQFHMVHPDGGVFDRAQVLEMVRNGWGNYAAEDGDSGQSRFQIEIRNVNVRASVDDGAVVLVSYEEWQRTADSNAEARGRSSVVLFYEDDSCVNGLSWASVHERWIEV